jgi:hypothetical protein
MDDELDFLLDTIEWWFGLWIGGLVLAYLLLLVLWPIIILYLLIFFRPQLASLLTRAVSIRFLGFRLEASPQESGESHSGATTGTSKARAARRRRPS